MKKFFKEWWPAIAVFIGLTGASLYMWSVKGVNEVVVHMSVSDYVADKGMWILIYFYAAVWLLGYIGKFLVFIKHKIWGRKQDGFSMDALADHIIAVAHATDRQIDGWQLQMIMFWEMESIKRDDKLKDKLSEIYDRPFYTTCFGPTVKAIAERYPLSEIIDDKGKFSNLLSPLSWNIKTQLNASTLVLQIGTHDNPLWAQYTLNHMMKPYGLDDFEREEKH
jgi:hypothetical protein